MINRLPKSKNDSSKPHFLNCKVIIRRYTGRKDTLIFKYMPSLACSILALFFFYTLWLFPAAVDASLDDRALRAVDLFVLYVE